MMEAPRKETKPSLGYNHDLCSQLERITGEEKASKLHQGLPHLPPNSELHYDMRTQTKRSIDLPLPSSAYFCGEHMYINIYCTVQGMMIKYIPVSVMSLFLNMQSLTWKRFLVCQISLPHEEHIFIFPSVIQMYDRKVGSHPSLT